MGVTLNGKPVSAPVDQIAPEASKPMAGSLAKLKGIKPSTEVVKQPAEIIPPVPSSSLFDYGALPADIAQEAKASAHAVRKSLHNLNKGYITIGVELRAMKAKLPHGQFGLWLKAECDGISESTAQTYMLVSKYVEDNPGDAGAPITAILALASSGTPQEAKYEIKEKLATEGHVKTAEVKAIVKKAKTKTPDSGDLDTASSSKAVQPAKAKPDATPPQQPASAQKPAPEPSEASLDKKAERAKAKIVYRLRTELKPDERLDFSALCITAGWTELGLRLGDP